MKEEKTELKHHSGWNRASFQIHLTQPCLWVTIVTHCSFRDLDFSKWTLRSFFQHRFLKNLISSVWCMFKDVKTVFLCRLYRCDLEDNGIWVLICLNSNGVWVEICNLSLVLWAQWVSSAYPWVPVSSDQELSNWGYLLTLCDIQVWKPRGPALGDWAMVLICGARIRRGWTGEKEMRKGSFP